MRASVNPDRIGIYERTIVVRVVRAGLVLLACGARFPDSCCPGDRCGLRVILTDIGIGSCFCWFRFC